MTFAKHCWLALFGVVVTTAASAAPFELQPNDHVCIIGNTLGERMQHTGWLETLLVAKYPQHNLVFRNLAYSGDEITGYRDGNKRMRSRDFGSQDQWLAGNAPCPQPDKLSSRDKEVGHVSENRFGLTNTNADVVFAFYGYGEAWAGTAGLDQFKKDVAGFIDHTLAQKYNGESAPKLVLVSPLPLIDMQDPNLPGEAHVNTVNAQLKLYTAAMAEVAQSKGVTFVDVFTPNSGDMRPTPAWSINGLHLTEAGDMAVATQIMSALFPNTKMGDGKSRTELEPLRQAINDKNWYWFHRYRTTDGYSTYGDRAFLKFSEGPGGYGDGLSNYSVMQKELETLDVLTSNRDKVVWAAANGKTEKPVDDNLPKFLNVITNKPGPLEGGQHLYLSGQEAIEKMTVHQGMKVELFADETQFPELVNPVQMSYDTQGRLWVAVWPSYPHWQPTQTMSDKLLILEDNNHDGKADTCKTFAGDIHNPTGFEFWNGGVIIAQGPDIWFLKDTNGDDQYDVKERLVHGLDTADTHHTANSFAMEPGGAVYFQEGTFHHTQVETPWGPNRRVANGAVFRLEPRTHKFDVYVSFGFANPHGHIFEKWGQDIVWDGTGSQPYHATLFSGDIDYPHKHGRPPQVYKQRTRPCPGTEVLSSSHFPEEMRGNLLVGNVIGFQGILQYKLLQNGASFGAEEVEPIVFSSDVNFRPSDLEVAPDGTIMFTEWQNPIIGHMQHNLRDPSRDKVHGRIYRVRMADKEPLQPVAIAGEAIPKLLSLLESPDDRVRHRARIELSARPTDEVMAATKTWMAALPTGSDDYEHHLMEALWLHQSHNVVHVDHLKRMLRSPDDRARSAATRVLVAWRDRVPEPLELLRTQVNDESARVRLQAIWGLSYFHGAEAAKASEVVVESLLYDQDEFLKFQLEETNKTLDRRAKSAQ